MVRYRVPMSPPLVLSVIDFTALYKLVARDQSTNVFTPQFYDVHFSIIISHGIISFR
jgi:hypothetical protein